MSRRLTWPSPPRPCVVLGIAPASDGATAWSADSKSGARLAQLAGLRSPLELPRYYALDNLLPVYLPTFAQLREAAALYQFLPGWLYVLAGSQVVKALGTRARPRGATYCDGPGVLSWYESREGVLMAVLPHPSGRNRWYNRAENVEAARRFLRRARWVEELPTGEAAAALGGRDAGGAHRRWRADRARNDRRRQEPRRRESAT